MLIITKLINFLSQHKKKLQIFFLILLIAQTISLIIIYNDLNNHYNGKPDIKIYYTNSKNSFTIYNVLITKNDYTTNNLTELFDYVVIINNSIYPKVCSVIEHKELCKIVTMSTY